MQFDPTRVAFGRHESFGLRYGWLTKGMQAFIQDPKIFEGPDATVTLGVGKNMVKSIKYWLQAVGVIERTGHAELGMTELGEYVFGENGVDKYLEDDATLWLMHWSMSTNPASATVFFWFFNMFHRVEFASDDVSFSLQKYLDDNIEKKFVHNTIRKDVQVLLKMYSNSRSNSDESVELESPFSNLGLISYFPREKVYRSRLSKRAEIPVGVFGYSLMKYFESQGSREIPIESLMYTKNGNVTVGSVFRLSEEGFLYLVDVLIDYMPGVFRYSESAGLRQLYLIEDIDPMQFLYNHFM